MINKVIRVCRKGREVRGYDRLGEFKELTKSE